jgi:N-glycosylase/DNA lyase
MKWGYWQELPKFGTISNHVLRELLDGGQSFRWYPVDTKKKIWQGTFRDVLLEVYNDSGQTLKYRLPEGSDSDMAVFTYFGCNIDWEKCWDSLPWRSDAQLKEFMEAFPGLRILRQPLGETLFTFLCSTAKQINQIKQCCLSVAERFGPKLSEGIYGWPGWSRLANATENELRQCKLGYRAKYIAAIAQILRERKDFEEEILGSDYQKSKELLLSLPGVGDKVADCVLLFGAGKLEAFPVDTWILKSMSRIYKLENWDPGRIAHFGRMHFGEHAGLAQQFLFAGERRLSV